MTNINLGKALLLTVMLLLTRSEVFAEFYLQPSLTLREEYNDNIYLEEDDQEDDFITSITPGISLGWRTEGVDLTLVRLIVRARE